jgi:hypothetical protein
MPSSSVISPTPPKTSQAPFREQLAQLEATLLEARGRVLLSFDRELASLRGWMDALQQFDPTVGMQTVQELVHAPLEPSFEELIAEPPYVAPCNIVPFRAPGSSPETLIEEEPLDPALANATIDELNAALAAAFRHMAQEPRQESRSA